MKGKGIVAPKSEKKQHAQKNTFEISYGKHVGATRPEDGEFDAKRKISHAKLISILTEHKVRSTKEGPYITRPMVGDGSRSDANAGEWSLVPVDIDELQAEEVPLLLKWCTESKLAGVIYTTYSHRPEQPKYRMFLFTDRPVQASEHAFLHRTLSGMVPFKLDPCMAKPSQPIYLPSCPAEHAQDAYAQILAGDPLKVDLLLEGAREEMEAEQRRKAERIAGVSTGVRQPGGLIEFFNKNYDLPALLHKHGYKQKGRNRYVAPGSRSGRAAVLLGEHGVMSFHDPEHDVLAVRNQSLQAVVQDTFAIFCKLEHAGNFKAAFSAAAESARSQGWEDPVSPPGTAWAEPSPLVAKIASEPYPVDALPDGIRKAAIEVQAFVKAPMPLVVGSAVAPLSAAAQTHFNVERAARLTGPISIFQLVIADSGERKSTCDSFFTPALREYEKKQADAKKPDIEKYRAAYAAWEAKRTGILTAIREGTKNGKNTAKQEADLQQLESQKPQEPRVAKILIGDSTSEHLAYSLAFRYPSQALISSEGGLVFGSHSMGTDAIMRNLTLYNVLWDGGTHDIGRRTSESFSVHDARLTVSIQVQGPTFLEFFDKNGQLIRGTGFTARFLLYCPESTQGHRPFTDPPQQWHALNAFNQRITDILNKDPDIDKDGALKPKMLLLSSDAKNVWRKFHDSIEEQLCNGGNLRDIRDVASKAADNCARLAALFHVFCMGNSPKGSAGHYISVEHMQSAAKIVAWHVNESRRFFGELALPEEQLNAAKLDNWLLDYCRREKTHFVPIAKLQQSGPAGLRRRETIEKTMRELDELNRARLVRDGRKKMVEVNPALLGKDAA